MKKSKKIIDNLSKHSNLSVILIYNVVTVIVFIVFYPLIPILMGYPPGFIENGKKIGLGYTNQYIFVTLFTVAIGTLIFYFALKGINGWGKFHKGSSYDKEYIRRLREKCINIPYVIYIGQLSFVCIPLVIVFGVVTVFLNAPITIGLRIFTIAFSLFSLAAVFSHTFTKSIFTRILLKTYGGEGLQGRRIKLRNKIFLQILPMIIVAILFTAVFGYSRLIEEKGDLIYKICKDKMTEEFKGVEKIDSTEQLLTFLKRVDPEGIKVNYFIIDPGQKITTDDGYKFSKVFIYGIMNPVGYNRAYGDSTESQAVVLRVKGNDGEYVAGVRFEVASNKTVGFFLFGFIALLAMNIFVLYFFSKTLSGEISVIAESLNDIAEGEQVDLNRKLAVVSNDELADLVIAFNKIQEREKEHIKEIEEKHAIMIAQERLATLGHLIGGIAHNLRTPIMSLSGAIEGLRDLIEEYDESVEDVSVTKEDHHEIAKEMMVWIEKMRPYCTYMSDIITAVKGQAMQRNNEAEIHFTLDELNKRIAILFEYELRKQHCKLNTAYNINMNTKINGDISDLVQILNNLIINAVDAYEGSGGNIELTVNGSDKVIEFIIKDYGKGIPKDVQKRLFKEMITTKGKNGTGLGLYMSYSNIKARFGGKMRFESIEGKGTTFYIYIPIKQNVE